MRDRIFRWSLVAAAGMNAGIAGGAMGQIQAVIRTTDAVPGTSSGEAWSATSSTFSDVGIDDFGNVLIRGVLATGTGGVSGANAAGYWYGAPGSLSLFARDGAAGPTLPNPNNWVHNNAAGTGAGLGFTGGITSNGTLLMNSQLFGTGATSTNNTAFWTGPYNGMQMIAQRGFTPLTAPGTSGAAFASNMNNSTQKINVAGQSLFNSTLTGGDTVSGSWTTSNVTNDSGLWLGGPSGVSLVVREGDPAPTTGGAIFGDITNIANHSINASGAVEFNLGLRNAAGAPGGVSSTNANACWSTAGGSLSLVARASDPVPGLPGVFYGTGITGQTPQNFNNGGRMIYNASFGTGATSGVDSEAIMTWTQPAGASVLYRTNSPAPGALGAAGATFKTFNGSNMQGRLNNNNVLAFATQVQGGGTATANDEMIFTAPVGGTPQMIAREGDPVPGLSGVNFGSGIINASGLILNNLNEVAFVNVLSDGTTGLFTWDPALGLSMVLHTTQSGVVPGLGTITSIQYSNGGNGDGGSSSLSDTGWLTFGVGDSSGAYAIVRTQVPAPASLALLGLGGLVAARRRR